MKLGVKLSVAIFIQGKNISRKLCIHKNILPNMKYFLLNISCISKLHVRYKFMVFNLVLRGNYLRAATTRAVAIN